MKTITSVFFFNIIFLAIKINELCVFYFAINILDEKMISESPLMIIQDTGKRKINFEKSRGKVQMAPLQQVIRSSKERESLVVVERIRAEL
jgi:hypothetical protein